jgi:hypothetical protein
MKIRYSIISLCLLTTLGLNAQSSRLSQGFTYSAASPTGVTKDFCVDATFRGFNYEGYFEVGSHFALGWLLGWNVFYNKLSNQTYVNDNATVHGTQYRYMNEFPMLLRGLYLFGEKDKVRPFAGGDMGVIYNVRDIDLGVYSNKKMAWQFAVAPEIGIVVPLKVVSLTTGIRYNYAMAGGDLDEVSYFSFNLGILFTKKNNLYQ